MIFRLIVGWVFLMSLLACALSAARLMGADGYQRLRPVETGDFTISGGVVGLDLLEPQHHESMSYGAFQAARNWDGYWYISRDGSAADFGHQYKARRSLFLSVFAVGGTFLLWAVYRPLMRKRADVR